MFADWWKAYLPKNLCCMNYRKDFAKAYAAGASSAYEAGFNAGVADVIKNVECAETGNEFRKLEDK